MVWVVALGGWLVGLISAVSCARCVGSFPDGHVPISRGSAGRMNYMLNALEPGTVLLEAKDGVMER